VDSGAAFTGGAGDDTFNADVSTMQALDVVNGGAGTDTLSIRDSVSIASRPGSHTGFEVLNVESTSGSVGQVAAAATIAARQQFTIDFTAAVFGGAATTTLTVTVDLRHNQRKPRVRLNDAPQNRAGTIYGPGE
jgi:hypothetical protein